MSDARWLRDVSGPWASNNPCAVVPFVEHFTGAGAGTRAHPHARAPRLIDRSMWQFHSKVAGSEALLILVRKSRAAYVEAFKSWWTSRLLSAAILGPLRL